MFKKEKKKLFRKTDISSMLKQQSGISNVISHDSIYILLLEERDFLTGAGTYSKCIEKQFDLKLQDKNSCAKIQRGKGTLKSW